MPSLASLPNSGPLPSGGMDAGVLQNLLALCGPETGRELLVRIVKDLTALAESLRVGAEAADPEVIRAQSHVLIAIAGTIGAGGVQLLAQGLNDRAQPGREAPPLWLEARAVAAAAEALAAHVAAIPHPAGAL